MYKYSPVSDWDPPFEIPIKPTVICQRLLNSSSATDRTRFVNVISTVIQNHVQLHIGSFCRHSSNLHSILQLLNPPEVFAYLRTGFIHSVRQEETRKSKTNCCFKSTAHKFLLDRNDIGYIFFYICVYMCVCVH